jgi:DNA repair exonuclease SbcCD nuclease subunit
MKVKMMSKYLKKSLIFNDIHFGRKDNSIIHNQDCERYIDWIIDYIKKDSTIDNIIFQGDWHEHRNSINGLTLEYSYNCAKKLNSLNIPIFFDIGNHDLYYRNNRNTYTTQIFESLENFNIIDKITHAKNLGKDGALIVPFLFENEYSKLIEYVNKIPVFFGHFEFKGFVITGDTIEKEHGPDHKDLKNVRRIFSGHFHKRQIKDNVIYVGSTFPMDFSDVNDNDRGFALYDFDNDKVSFVNWTNQPSYIDQNLSIILDDPNNFLKKDAVVRSYDDIGLNYDEVIKTKSILTTKYNLREFTIVDSFINPDISIDNSDIDDDTDDIQDINTLIKNKLRSIKADNIDNKKLIKIYEGINI